MRQGSSELVLSILVPQWLSRHGCGIIKYKTSWQYICVSMIIIIIDL